ncbi:hypothetical protein JCM30471_16600 [Desulfuromonas carbonis]|uniref:formylglycine-generating enzyme family protein n=1 Tax=Desulfuromonas sp. DDH964 TaxID=1823759 RepID=UPI00078DF9AE|nr:formylglycine-generating enzyme family protein [Desulfuromonas sp. DDH964]AMV73258.1 protein 3-oxoalanine-generating enzyme family protein [Desulfuromonas sp. DDH964]
MVAVKGGCFQMGDTFGDGDSDEKPVHKVCVDDFWIGKTEVTQGQWHRLMGNNPSYFSGCGDDCPVERVSWCDVQEFLYKLNQQTGKNFWLPTEAEWRRTQTGARLTVHRGCEKGAGHSSESVRSYYAYSEPNFPPIPMQTCQSFRRKVSTRSDPNFPV